MLTWLLYEARPIFTPVALLAAILAVSSFMYWLGRRSKEPLPEADRSIVNAMQIALIGLVSLILGFSFSSAVNRHDMRRALVQDEANAIGTTYLRAALLPAATRGEVRQLLRDYIAVRIGYYRGGYDLASQQRGMEQTSRLQTQIWNVVAAFANADPRSTEAAILVQSTNNMFELSAKQRTAINNRVPAPLLYLIIISTLVAAAVNGYYFGRNAVHQIWPSLVFAATMVLVLGTIVDLDRPQGGLIVVPLTPLELQQQSMR